MTVDKPKGYLEGIVPAIASPLESDGQHVDWAGLGNLIDFQIAAGVNGLFALGSTGEAVLFDTETRKEIAEFVVRHVAGRIPVVVHTGSVRQQEVLELSLHAIEVGADAIAVVPPFYYALDDLALELFFSGIARAIDGFPMYLYNIPGNAKNFVSSSLFLKLSNSYPNVIGMKESSMDFDNFYRLVQAALPHHSTLMGNDSQFLPALAVGGSGSISAGATAFPEPFVALYRAFKSGNTVEARKHQETCAQLRRILVAYPGANHKMALRLRGIIKSGAVSPPLRQLSDEEIRGLELRLRELGCLAG